MTIKRVVNVNVTARNNNREILFKYGVDFLAHSVEYAVHMAFPVTVKQSS